MPLFGRKFPPRKCPVCGERLWYEDKLWAHTAWQYYNVHVHANHPEFERLIRRTGFYYLIPITLFIGSAPAGLLVQGHSVATQAVILSFWASAFTVFVATLLVRYRGTHRFRESWREVHGSPIAQL